MYPYEITHANADPQGAPEIDLTLSLELILIIALFGKNGTRCFATQIGPTPGPPPPCGIANVLCRYTWMVQI